MCPNAAEGDTAQAVTRGDFMHSRLGLVLMSTLLIAPFISSRAQEEHDGQSWLTTPDRSALLTPQKVPLHFSATADAISAIEVNDVQQFQSIDGFGFALTGGSAQLLMRMEPARRAALLKELFSGEGKGIDVSYLRVSIGSSDMNERVYSYDDVAEGQTDEKLSRFSLAPDCTDVIPLLKEILAIRPEIEILGSPWSAPAWMKTNDNAKGGYLKPEYYASYADYLVKYIEGMKAEGIRIEAITVQNEPLNPKNTPSMAMFASQEDAFIAKYLVPAFKNAGILTKILLYDHNPDVPSYPLSILADPAAGKYVDGTAFHLYGGDVSMFSKVHDEYPNKNLYMTEQMVTGATGDAPFDIAEPVRGVLIGATRNWSRNVLLWNLAADPRYGPHTSDGGCTMCQGAITVDGNIATRNVAYYAIAHFSKFVPPGSVRIGSNSVEQLANVAFVTPERKIVLVVSNTANFPKTFSVRYHGKSFTTDLPAESVGTYVW
jgi:glucosylceramidase